MPTRSKMNNVQVKSTTEHNHLLHLFDTVTTEATGTTRAPHGVTTSTPNGPTDRVVLDMPNAPARVKLAEDCNLSTLSVRQLVFDDI